MNVLDLFSGVGGFSLGLERAGMRTIAFCEIEPFCRAVLAKHWPDVPIFDDIRTLKANRLDLRPDLICGGFPCQDISHAAGAKARGLAGERSGLWFEMRRLMHECRPDWMLIENVPRLRTLGADTVLADLEEAGYTARPLVVGAIHAGADHIRRRVWIIANAHGLPVRHESGRSGRQSGESSSEPEDARTDANRQSKSRVSVDAEMAGRQSIHRSPADASGEELEIGQGERGNIGSEQPSAERSPSSLRAWEAGPFDGDPVADGLPEDMDAALKAYGNAVVPQLAELLGRAIMRVSN